jgi:subtilisin family serine protease
VFRPRRPSTRRPRVVPALALAVVTVLSAAAPVAARSEQGSVAPTASITLAAPDPLAKLRGDLAALVDGSAVLDPRLAGLVPGFVAGEIPAFALLTAPPDATRLAQLTQAGARILRTYRTIDLVALAGDAATIRRLDGLAVVARMAPIEVIVAQTTGPAPAHPAAGGAAANAPAPLPDQTRTTAGDLGAPALWDAGISGGGIRIAILDTGLDISHPDLDDRDFRAWSALPGPAKVVDARNFSGGACTPGEAGDRNGHGTHVAGIAAGTGEGGPSSDDDGRVVGLAPGAELAIGKVFTDAGAGINSDLIAAMEWAALPADPAGCAIGAQIVNMSLGSEARPTRLNTDGDVDFVGLVLDRLTIRYGTLFVASAGNSGPYIGSVLEAPGTASQALSVAATAKDWDVNHDDTQAGDTCAGWLHPRSPNAADNDCAGGDGTQPSSVSAFSSRGPSGDGWLRPDVAAPGYDIVSAQAATGLVLAQNDLNRGTRSDPLYATATGTSMAAPATSGAAALVLDGYRQRYGASPSGASGLTGLRAGAATLLRAALMNTARTDLYESRWILTVDAATRLACPADLPDPEGLCAFSAEIANALTSALGSLTLMEVRNGSADPFVGSLASGAGKIQPAAALAALRDGVVVYSAASGSGATAGTGHRDLQGSWQIGPLAAGSKLSQAFVVHAAPAAAKTTVRFAFGAGHPSDGTTAIPTSGAGAWTISLPGQTKVAAGADASVTFSVTIPAGAAAGLYSGVVVATTDRGQVLRIPVFAAVPLHDPSTAAGNAPGAQARFASARDVYAKGDTVWPSVVGTAGTGSSADWLVYPVELGTGLASARFSVWDAAAGDETYDLYVYDAAANLIASTHPFATAGVTDVNANNGRPPTTAAAPGVVTLQAPPAGRWYVAVSRARVGGTSSGDFGAFVLALDEVGPGG